MEYIHFKSFGDQEVTVGAGLCWLEAPSHDWHGGGSYSVVVVHLDEAEVYFGSRSCD